MTKLKQWPIWDLLAEEFGGQLFDDKSQIQDIQRLSSAFTEDRASLSSRTYLQTPQAERAYLAYYVPLNALKLSEIFQAHPEMVDACFDLKEDSCRVADYGAGPGTGSLAFLTSLATVALKTKKKPPLVEIHLIDHQTKILGKAKSRVLKLAKILNLDVKVFIWKNLSDCKHFLFNISICANVLNELPGDSAKEEDENDDAPSKEPLLELFEKTSHHFLALEPSHRVASQRLIRFRERLLQSLKDKVQILGPCTHQGKCPLYRTKHWCHFSQPLRDTTMREINLEVFDNPRLWLKFSYLCVERVQENQAKREQDSQTYRAIGDLHLSGPNHMAIDLCQPVEKKALRLPKSFISSEVRKKLTRGTKVKLKGERLDQIEYFRK